MEISAVADSSSVTKEAFEQLIIRHGRTGAPWIWAPEVAEDEITAWRDAERAAREAGRKSQSRVKKPAGAWYSRTTRAIDMLDDKSNLMDWRGRMVARGMALSDALRGDVQAITDPESPEGKKALQKAAEDAVDVAQGNLKRDLGTAIHAIFEDIDEGREPDFVPPEYEPLVEDYKRKTVGWSMVAVEQFCVLDEFKIAGTFDRLVLTERDGSPILAIGDLKAGSLAMPGKFALQLAAYAHMEAWDPLTNTRRPLQHMGIPVSQEYGYIISVPSTGTDEVSIWEVDLVKGWEGLHLCQQVREWRSYWSAVGNQPKRIA